MSNLSRAVTVTLALLTGIVPGEGASTTALVSATATLGGNRFTAYATEQAIADAITASEITAGDGTAIRAEFASNRKPSQVAVIRKAGGESYDDALVAATTAGMAPGLSGYLWATIDSRAVADVELAGAYLAGKGALLIAQNGSADALTSGLPAGLTLQAQTILGYHDTDAQLADHRLAGACAGVPRPTKRPSGRGPLPGLAPYAVALTPTQKTNALANGYTIIDKYDDPSTSPLAFESPKTMTGVSLAVAHSRVYILATVDLVCRRFLNDAWAVNESIPTNELSAADLVSQINSALRKLIDAGDVQPSEDYPSGSSLAVAFVGGRLDVTGSIFGNEDLGEIKADLIYTIAV